ncbi:unnamed protein product [Sympodiomycopsis kandeliae]
METPPRKRARLSQEKEEEEEEEKRPSSSPAQVEDLLEKARKAANDSRLRNSKNKNGEQPNSSVKKQLTDGKALQDEDTRLDDSDQREHSTPQSTVSHPRSRSPSQSRTPSRSRSRSRSHSPPPTDPTSNERRPMPPYESYPAIHQSNSIHSYTRLNQIEEGSYGIVYRARHNPSGDIVAIKRLKMETEKQGFPITSLREIRTLTKVSTHPNVVHLREIVVGDTLTQIYLSFEFIEHDLKTLLTQLEKPFSISEIKTLSLQLIDAVGYLHSKWIIHRDLKTSNLLINNRGQIKLADFGLARLYGDHTDSSTSKMTQLVVTLWYRSPELLLGEDRYDTAIDMWSIGCIIAEMVLQEPLLPGRNESDQLQLIFKTLGQPDASIWPSLPTLPHYKSLVKQRSPHQPYSLLRKKFPSIPNSSSLLDLLHKLLTYDPSNRITAKEALLHTWFEESPRPAHPDTFPTFPSFAAGEIKKVFKETVLSPKRQRAKQADKSAGEKKEYSMEWDF